MANVRLAVLGSTRGSDLQMLIEAIGRKELRAEIVLVVSNKADAYIVERAANHKIEVFIIDYKSFKTREEAEAKIVEELKKRNIELVLLTGYNKIITPLFVNAYRARIWNIHPSLLPKYPGLFDLKLHAEVIKNHETETGCTLHEVSEEVDKGKVLMQKRCKVDPGETPETLKEKVQKLEQECFIEAINKVAEGKLKIGVT